MGKLVPLQTRWDRGMRRDHARTDMPNGSLWNAVDVISERGAPLRQRAGWSYYSISLGGNLGVRSGVYAVFATSAGGTDPQNLAVQMDGSLFKITSSTATSIGTAVAPLQNPIFHGGTAASAATAVYTGLVIIPNGSSSSPTVPKKYNGTTLSDLNGSPPKAKYATVYKDYTVLGNGKVGSTFYPNRVWFSPEGDPDCAVSSVTAWDTTDSWIDFSREVIGMGSLRSSMFVFHQGAVSRVRGAIPPPDSDMVVDDCYFDVGLISARTIVTHQDQLIWAAPEGVFRTDGVQVDDLTARGGMRQYWDDLIQNDGYSGLGLELCAGVLRNTYFLFVVSMDVGPPITYGSIDGFAIDLETGVWTRLSNFTAGGMWSGQLESTARMDELFWGRIDTPRVARLGSIYETGDSSFKSDASGSFFPTVETQFYRMGSPGLKRIRSVYIGHEITDYASDNPTAAVSYITTPEETSYTSTTTLSEGTTYKRSRVDINKQAHGVALKIERSNAGDFLLYDIEADAWQLEATRRV